MPRPSNHSLVGDCLAPFYDWTKFPAEGGFIGGRMCASMVPGDANSPYCCLPCPATDWVYADNFDSYMTASSWLNVVGIVLLAFMLLSYSVLPAQQTKNHYLSVCLTVSVLMIAIGFTIPLAAKPEQCFNEITPNDMYSSMECAWSGAFIIGGGLSVVAWILIRSLSMTLQICFDIVPGRRFFYCAQALGWGVPAILFAATLAFTGVSFRFGTACHVNHDNSLADFWGPLLGMAGAAGILQCFTFGYCLKVYLKNLWADRAAIQSSNGSSHLPSYSGSLRTQTARAIWRRLQKVLWLQWRGLTIVTIILVDVVFFSVAFVYLDNRQANALHSETITQPWIFCLAAHPTDKTPCLPLAQEWLVNQPTVIAVIMLLSLAGVQLFLFLSRPTIFRDWVRFIRFGIARPKEFVPADAKVAPMRSLSQRDLLSTRDRSNGGNNAIEMHKSDIHVAVVGIESPLTSPNEAYRSPIVRTSSSPSTTFDASPAQQFPSSPPVIVHDPPSLELGFGTTTDYFGPTQTLRQTFQRHDSNEGETHDRSYRAPVTSFSAIRTSQAGLGLQRHATKAERRAAEQEAEFASWRNHNLWPRDAHHRI